MPQLNPIKANLLIKLLKEDGFVLQRTHGSHHFFLDKNTGRTTVVPVHSGEEISGGLLKKILRDIEWSREMFDQKRNIL